MPSSDASWLTEKRLRAQATVLGLCLWLFFAWQISNPGLLDRSGNFKGTDFLHFYTIGSLAAEHRGADLYDMSEQAALAAQRVPAAAGIRYLPLYPPQVSILFSPLSRLPYGAALLLWWACSAAIYSACVYEIWKVCPNLGNNGGTVWLAAIAYPPFFHLIAWGQTSALALACFSATFLFLRSRMEFAAGLAFGCLIFKPQLGLAAAIVFIAAGMWRTIGGAILSAAAQLGVGVLYYGVAPWRAWITTLFHSRTSLGWLEPRPYQTHSLRTFWSMLVPWPDFALALYLLTAVAALSLTIACWKKSANLAIRFSSLLLTTVLVSPHLTVYDLVILAPAFLLLADWLLTYRGTNPGIGVLLYLIYLLPLLGPYSRWTHVQVSVIAMTWCVHALWRIRGTAAEA